MVQNYCGFHPPKAMQNSRNSFAPTLMLLTKIIFRPSQIQTARAGAFPASPAATVFPARTIGKLMEMLSTMNIIDGPRKTLGTPLRRPVSGVDGQSERQWQEPRPQRFLPTAQLGHLRHLQPRAPGGVPGHGQADHLLLCARRRTLRVGTIYLNFYYFY